MKKFALLFSFLFLLCISHSALALNYNKIVFFGDSLSDNGNFYSGDWGFMPKSPPYYKGQFSNGPVWTEDVAHYFNEKEGVQSINYALGGETVVFHNPVKGYLPYSLTAALNSYLLRTFWEDRSQTLFIFWIGINDYRPGVAEIDAVTSDVVNNIKYVIEQLMYYGGRYFLVFNLPDAGKSPYAQHYGLAENLSALVKMHNTKLAAMLPALQAEHKEALIRPYDAYGLFEDVVAHPDQYNKKYHTHFQNVTEACWQGGYLLNQTTPQTEQTVVQQITKELQSRQALHINQHTKPFPIAGFAQYIATSPDLREAYRVSQAAAKLDPSCSDPDSYIFWDEVHPTRAVHQILSILIIEEIKRYYS